MKTCLRLTLFACLLLLPMFTMAAQPLVPVPPCCEGNPYTIRIPVKLHGMNVEYVWYRNDMVVGDTVRTAGITAIPYTVPANEAHSSAVYHFKYCLNDGCDVWLSSPKYLLTFMPGVHLSAITGSTVEVCASQAIVYSVENEAGVSYNWTVPNGWEITAGQGSSSITVIPGAAVAAASPPANNSIMRSSAISGGVSVVASNNCDSDTAQTPAIAVVDAAPTLVRSGGDASQTFCSDNTELVIEDIMYTWGGSATGFSSISWSPSRPSGISESIIGSTIRISGAPTAIGSSTYTISTVGQLPPCVAAVATGTITRGGINVVGSFSITAYSCNGGISSAGSISVAARAACTAITDPGYIEDTITVHTCAGVEYAGVISLVE